MKFPEIFPNCKYYR